ncbi:MAG: P27 family phage terminase small subunit [Saprospirales bacterium]|nr:P27 family phage terminase small subunit [Saprospirales bacterium]
MYYAICNHLKAVKALQSIDSVFVSAAAHSAYLMGKHSKSVGTDGAVQVFANGTTNITGDYSVLKNERTDFFRFCRELGMTPKSREQILAFANKTTESADPAEALIKKMSGR